MGGTTSRSFLTVFELTFGNWVPATRCPTEEVSELFGPVLMAYRAVVGEAVVKVIAGVFLYETFKAASSDDELMIMQKERQLNKYMGKILRLFNELDENGDGYLTHDSFCEV